MTATRPAIGVMSILFVAAGIALVAIAGWMVSRDPAVSGAVLEAQGEVVDLERSRGGNQMGTYRPVVVFRDTGGTAHRFTGSIGSNPPDYTRGDKVTVRYDPAVPEEAVIDSWAARLLGPGLPAGMGLLLLWLEARALRSAWRARRRGA
jgi:Protein of unknown function (DUF3592)